MTLAALLVAALSASPDVEFVETRLDVGGELLGRHVVDLDADGRDELLVVARVRRPDGTRRRELRLHAVRADGRVAHEPDLLVPVMEDVVAFGVADVRSEPGRELLFLTPGGVWSYSPTLPGYRDNVAPLADERLVYDLPDPAELPRWRYVLERPGGDLVLVPGRDGASLWVPAADGYRRAFALGPDGPTPEFEGAEPAGVGVRGRGVRVEVRNEGAGMFLTGTPRLFSRFLETDRDYRAPAFVDADGDGLRDVIVRVADDDAGPRVAVHLSRADGVAASPSRYESILDADGEPLDLDDVLLVDVDGDGDDDAIVSDRGEGSGLEARRIDVRILRNDGARLFPAAPAQVLRFEANEVLFSLHDVDADGRRDLIVTTFRMPAVADLVGGFELRRTTLLYLGEAGGRPFARRPAAKDERVFALNDLEQALVRRQVSEDLSGDGVADVVEIDLLGTVSIRRFLRTRGFFGGESWELEAVPWRRFGVRGSIADVTVADLNGDGLGDVLTGRGGTLSVLVSRRP